MTELFGNGEHGAGRALIPCRRSRQRSIRRKPLRPASIRQKNKSPGTVTLAPTFPPRDPLVVTKFVNARESCVSYQNTTVHWYKVDFVSTRHRLQPCAGRKAGLYNKVRSFGGDETGASVIIVALTLPALIGAM